MAPLDTSADMVYPRVCGGTIPEPSRHCPSPGLSPRVRGNRGRVVLWLPRRGSIPACAGEPCGRGNGHSCQRVYPRVCGGTACWCMSCLRNYGLSPRVRGNRLPDSRRIGYYRSIPACAGEPQAADVTFYGPAVYPRVCGGTPERPRRRLGARGLSPRVRGNHGTARSNTRFTRSIPACAGEPRVSKPLSLRNAVYPRVCGGTLRIYGVGGAIGGLSPRVRGNPPARSTTPAPARSIPACAGEPGR